MSHSKMYTMKNFAKKNAEEGTWPSSEVTLWNLRSRCDNNGFSSAFITVGRRVLVDADRFYEIVESKGRYPKL